MTTKFVHKFADGEHVLRVGTVKMGDGERVVIATNMGVYLQRDDGTLKAIMGGIMMNGELVKVT